MNNFISRSTLIFDAHYKWELLLKPGNEARLDLMYVGSSTPNYDKTIHVDTVFSKSLKYTNSFLVQYYRMNIVRLSSGHFSFMHFQAVYIHHCSAIVQCYDLLFWFVGMGLTMAVSISWWWAQSTTSHRDLYNTSIWSTILKRSTGPKHHGWFSLDTGTVEIVKLLSFSTHLYSLQFRT